MNKRITEIIEELGKAIENSNIIINSETVFKEACCIYRGEMAGKDKKVFQKPSNQATDTSDRPSEKQIKYLSKLGVQIPPTKKLATEMISNYIENLKKDKI